MWGDFDHDGRPDVLLCGSPDGSTPQTRLYRNCGDGGFTDVSANLPDVLLAAAAWADFDRDGILDLALMGFNGAQDVAGIFRGHGDGTFTELGGLGAGFSSGAVAWGDFNNDGYPDVIFTGASSLVAHTVLYRNEPAPGGGRQFTPVANSRLPDLKDSSVAWGDFNNDGLPDLLLAGTTRLTSPERLAGIYLNNGAGEFNILAAGLPAVDHARVAVADFNRDGRLDVLVAGTTQTNRQTRLLLGNLTVTNTAPAAPAGLSATLTTKGLALAWATGTDGETPAPGLNYNVRITGPASRPVVLPAALADGTRLLPAAGNAGTTNVWQLRQYNLPTGLYTWDVQAIDSAFTGSAFSTNGSFYVEQPVVYSNGLGVDGHYQLQFTGTNQTYQVEMAPDLLDCGFSVWTRLGPATSNAPGQFEFRDPEGATQPSRFYRLVWP